MAAKRANRSQPEADDAPPAEATGRYQKKAAAKKGEYERSKAEAKAARDSVKAEAKAAKTIVKESAKVKAQSVVTGATKKVASAITERPDAVEPPWWRGRKGRGQREPISRDAIVSAAIDILDHEGADALTIRRLATELETGPATLYWHIAGKDELGELVYDQIMGEVDLPEPDPTRWEEQLKAITRQCYRVMLSHNDAVKLSIGRVPMGPNMLRMMEWLLTILRGAGIPDDVAGYFGDLLGRYIDASVLEETATPTFGGKELDPADAMAMVGEYFGSLSPAAFPNLTSMSGSMFKGDADSRFEMGLDILVLGLAAHIAKADEAR